MSSWHWPIYYSDILIGGVSGNAPTTSSNGYTATFIGNGESALTFNATTDRDGIVIECRDNSVGTDTCTITIAG